MHSSNRSFRLAAAGFVLATAWAVPATATPTFPDVIKEDLQLADSPDCTLCHEGTPKIGSVTTPFGAHMMERNLVAYDEDSLRTALKAVDGEKSDVDADGVPDIDELKAGTDPNGAGTDGSSDTPKYGCNNVSGAPPSAGAWLAFGLALVGLRRVFKRRVAA